MLGKLIPEAVPYWCKRYFEVVGHMFQTKKVNTRNLNKFWVEEAKAKDQYFRLRVRPYESSEISSRWFRAINLTLRNFLGKLVELVTTESHNTAVHIQRLKQTCLKRTETHNEINT